MFRFVTKKMFQTKWLMLCLITGCALAIAAIGSIPMFADGIIQRQLTMDFIREGEVKQQFPSYVHYVGDLWNYDSPQEKLEAYYTYDDFISRRINDRNAIEVITGVRKIKRDKLKIMDIRDWDIYLKEIDEERYRKSVSLYNGNAYGVSDMETVTELYEGEMYSPGKTYIETDGYKGEVYEAVISLSSLMHDGFLVGGVYTLIDPVGSGDRILTYQIVGVVDNVEEVSSQFNLDSNGVYFDYNTFREEILPETEMTISNSEWYFTTEYESMKVADIRHVMSWVEGNYEWALENESELVQIYSFLELLEDYSVESRKLTGYLMLLGIPLIFLVLFYILMISRLIFEQEKEEIAVLNSRGASRWQILSIYMWQSVITGGISYILGMILAYGFAMAMGYANGFMQFIRRSMLITSVSGNSLLAGLGCCLLFILTMVIPALRASKYSVIELKQGKAMFSKRPVWKILFLDVVFLGASIYLYRNYSRFIESMKFTEEGYVDFLIFFVVSFFIIGAGLFFVRIYPLVAGVVVTLFRRILPVHLYSALIYIRRGQKAYYFIIVFLVLSIGYGVFCTNAANTLNKDLEDRLWQEIGTEARLNIGIPGLDPDDGVSIIDVSSQSQKDAMYERLTHFDGIKDITRVSVVPAKVRYKGRKALKIGQINVMALTPEEFGEVIWQREDLYNSHINYYLNILARYPEGVILSRNIAENLQVELGDDITIIVEFKGVSYSIKSFILTITDYWPGHNDFYTSDFTGYKTEKGLCVAHYDFIKKVIWEAPTQVWMSKEAGITDNDINEYMAANDVSLMSYIYTDYRLSWIKKEPILYGINGILTLVFLVTMLISAIGFILYWIISIRERALQFGIFRAMGMKKYELVLIVLWEQLLISVMAVAFSIFIGTLTGEIFIPLFSMLEIEGERNLPFLLVKELGGYLRIYSAVLLIFTSCFYFLRRYVVRLKMDQAVKLGED